MPEPLTKLERRILDYLVDYLRRNTYQPSIREIGRRFDIKSTKTVSEYLQSLADKGWIERDPSRSRGVKLLGIDLHPRTVSVPCFEEAAALGDLELDRKLVGGTGAFSVVMAGNGMAEVGVHHGDLLLAEPATADELDEGDVVVVRVRGELAVKRFFRRGGEAVLEPSSSDYPPALLRAGGDVILIGRVVSVLRRLRAPLAAAPVAAAAGGRAS
ncbi:MAG TPA: transcriptional repressor LexA [Longimicrobiales bacterium]|nr:transcriptional repressor LexA [Longimicrobiales bacterium]